MSAEPKKLRKNPEESNFFIFNFLFTFMFKFVLGKKIGLDDVPDVAESEKSEKSYEKALKHWRPKFEKYSAEKEANERAKRNDPGAVVKEPEIPSILKLTLLFSPLFFLGQILAFLQGVIQLVQPYVVRTVLKAFTKKLNGEPVNPPYGWMVFLALTPIGLIFFDANASRLTVHAIVKLRAAFCSMLYDKVLRLNLGNDSGFLISLISFDSRTATEKIQEVVLFFWAPLKILVVFGQICFEVGLTELDRSHKFLWGLLTAVIAPILVVASMPIQAFSTRIMIKGYRNYLQTNDGRMKVTNESLQGMRVIKYGGLEEVFKTKILNQRNIQLAFCKTHIFGLVLMQSILHSVFILVQSVTISSFILIYKIKQVDTVLMVFPLAQMINNLNIMAAYIPNQVQGLLQVSICMRRIRTFLLIEEHTDYVVSDNTMSAHVEVVVPKGSSEEDGESKITANLPLAVRVEGSASFKWAPPPKIPLTPEQVATAARVEAEKKKQHQREMRIAERNKERVAKERKERQKVEEKRRKKRGGGEEGEDGTVGFAGSINEDSGGVETLDSESEIYGQSRPNAGSETTGLLASQAARPSFYSNAASPPPPAASSSTPVPAPSSTPTASPTPAFTPGGTPISRPTTIRTLNLAVPKGGLVMVVGTVGSGKSSLLAVVIGDIGMIDSATAGPGGVPLTVGSEFSTSIENNRLKPAVPAAPRVSVSGSVAYFAQSAWIFNATVKENILFGNPWDPARYEEAVRVCCLRPDFESLAGGDATMIGEKGVNLSGGQKARVQLARCVYSDSDVYLLDDPLSAVDAHVGKTIFEECIVKTLQARGKTVLLATNQLRFLSEADSVVVVDHGAVLDMGRLEELSSRGIQFEQKEELKKAKGKTKAAAVAAGETSNVLHVKKKKTKGNEKEDQVGFKLVASDTENVVLPRSLTGSHAKGNAAILLENRTTPVDDGDGNIPSNPVSILSSTSPSSSSSSSSSSSTAPGPAKVSKHDSKAQEAAKSLASAEEASAPFAAIKMPFKYVATYGNIIVIFIYFLFLLSGEFLLCMGTYWMGIVGDSERFKWIPFQIKLYVWMGFYFVAQIIYSSRALFYSAITKHSNDSIHRALLKHVFKAPISWIDLTPLGRLINRFSADLTQSDTVLHSSFAFVQHCWMTVVGLTASVCVGTPILSAVAVPCIVLYHILAFVYAPVAQNFQSLEGVARSPVMSLFEETITGAGLPTLRSAGKQELWKQKFFSRLDRWGETYALVRTGQKWCSLYASLISTILMTGIQTLGWIYMSPTMFGVGVTAIMIATYQSMFLIENFVDFESSLTNFERLRTYSYNLPQEMDCPKKTLVTPPPAWPANGQIEFDEVSFRYRSGLPFVLKDVSFVIQGGEKVGVCGRTGAGKTSILYALFRLVELDTSLTPVYVDRLTGKRKVQHDPNEEPNHGHIKIDGLDISHVAMIRARSSIAIIPQDPTLFTGTLRYNLDLRGACKDEEIWNVLDMIEMRQPVLEMGEEGLDIQVQEGGLNFSCGQRQLICLGRAMLNNCRIIVLDEATANIDMETDAKIQTIIKERFTDKTAIVIAHRLNTIIGFDKIMVMDDGHLSEYDSPQHLMANEESLFSQLLRASQQKKEGDGEED